MSKKKKPEEPIEEKKNPPRGNKNYEHAASEIDALRALLKNMKKDNNPTKDENEQNKKTSGK